MTARHRFLATLRDGAVGDPPRYEREIRDEVLARWHEQGLLPAVDPAMLFGLDRWQYVSLDALGLGLAPGADVPGLVQTPGEVVAWKRTYAAADHRPAGWGEQTAALLNRDWPLGLTFYRGLFQTFGVRNGDTLVQHLYFVSDHPDAAAEAMVHLAEVTVERMRPALAAIEPDFLLFGEPIAGNFGPVIGPATFRAIAAPFYRILIDAARQAGVGVFVWDTYGQVEPLIPEVLTAGINTLWIGHAGMAGTDYVALRDQLGPDIGLIGGIDARVLLEDEAAMRAEVERKAAGLARAGRWVPMLDDRARENVGFEAYWGYRRALDELLP